MSTIEAPFAASIDHATASAATCAHCSLPVPRGLIDPLSPHQFCCAGCRAVFGAIHACGLEGYYALRERTGATAAPARTTGKGYEAFDDPVFAGIHVRPAPGGLSSVELYLENVHCAACVWLIERLPHVLGGVCDARLDIRRCTVRLVWDPAKVALSRIARQLDRLSYSPHPVRGARDLDRRRAEDRRSLVRIGVAGAAAGNAMLIAFALYGGMLHGMEPGYAALFRWASLLVAVVSLAWPGRVFFERAAAALRAGTIHMDVPIAIGLAAGAAWSAVNTIRGQGEVYFESLTVLVFLLLVGRYLQLRAQRGSQDAVEILFSLVPGTARLVEGDGLREVPVAALSAGAVVEVAAGSSIPADGTVVRGRSRIDRSMLTGESWPVAVAEGEPVHAGTVNVEATLRFAVTATGEESRLGRLMRLIEEGAARRAPIVVLADRLSSWFAAVVLALAAATCALWLAIDPSRALPNAVALLVVTCPCALAMATPIAIVAAIGRAARAGILIKGGDVIERLRGPGLILLDKTGTLTAGRARVVAWHGAAALRTHAAAVERHSNHPIARAIAAECASPEAPEATAIRAESDGIEGVVGDRRIALGARGYFERAGIAIPGWASDYAADLAARAATPVFVAADGTVGAVAGVGDPLKPGAAEAIAALRRLGWSIGVLSGDDPRVVAATAAALGIGAGDCLGGLSPERKRAIVRERMRRGPVIMVGDGVNDAPALAAATVGVAAHGGAEASLSAADVYLSASQLSALVELLRGSRRTLSVIRLNLGVSLVYNVIGAALAIAGLMNPLAAAVLMPISSLTVVTHSCRARTFEVPPCP